MVRLGIWMGCAALLGACGDVPEPEGTTVATPAAAMDVTADDGLPMPLPENTLSGIAASDLRQRIKALSDDRFEGRGPGSEIGEKTADWLAAELQRIGVQPGGEDGTYFQTVGMVEQTLDAPASSLRFSGGRSGEDFPMTLKEDAVLWTKKQNGAEFSWADSELVFVGYGVVAPEYGWNDYHGLDVRGKTVVMLVNDPGYARGG
ncbi:MAG: hypothetical protein AAGF20_03835 [Pseudomonadota bacterium]